MTRRLSRRAAVSIVAALSFAGWALISLAARAALPVLEALAMPWLLIPAAACLGATAWLSAQLWRDMRTGEARADPLHTARQVVAATFFAAATAIAWSAA